MHGVLKMRDPQVTMGSILKSRLISFWWFGGTPILRSLHLYIKIQYVLQPHYNLQFRTSHDVRDAITSRFWWPLDPHQPRYAPEAEFLGQQKGCTEHFAYTWYIALLHNMYVYIYIHTHVIILYIFIDLQNIYITVYIYIYIYIYTYIVIYIK